MLATGSYPAGHVAAARARVTAAIDGFRALPAGAARDAFAPACFAPAILARLADAVLAGIASRFPPQD